MNLKSRVVDTERKTQKLKAAYRKNFSRQIHFPVLSRALILISIVVFLLQQTATGVEKPYDYISHARQVVPPDLRLEVFSFLFISAMAVGNGCVFTFFNFTHSV